MSASAARLAADRPDRFRSGSLEGQGYRPDIDGLRCLSVLAVFAFHASLPLSGGFVGVDVFFVISGYLITGLITSEVDKGTFSFRVFYARRIVRIIPALLAMTSLVFLLATIYLYPGEFTQLAASATWATLSSSNVFFYMHSNYFDTASRYNPLLHTWSLGVEEQFYLVYPILLVCLLRNWRRATKPIFIGIAIVSLALSAYWAHANPSAAYYLLPSRLWELLLGGLTSMFQTRLTAAFLRRVNPLPCLGLGMIVAATVLYSEATAFPGLAALLPCLGCCLLLADTRDTSWMKRVLETSPFVYIGRISYSLYLWHWPLITLQRTANVVHTGLGPIFDKLIVVGLIFLASDLSYRYVETPLRRGSGGWTRQRRALNILAASAAACTLFVFTVTAEGFPGRYSLEANRIVQFQHAVPSNYFRQGHCFLTPRDSFSDFEQAVCLRRPPNKKLFLLVGDSHASEFYAGFSASTTGTTTAVLQATATGCKPVLRDISPASTCGLMNEFLFNQYLPTHHVDLVVISARWIENDLKPLAETLAWLTQKGQPVVLLGPTPEYTQPLPRLLADLARRTRNDNVQSYLYPGIRELDRKMAALASQAEVRYVSLYAQMCPERRCEAMINNVPVYFDSGHLTDTASTYYASAILQQIDEGRP
jgi:peptidoglycan/LPS O-acetylase OafA/YrhL